MLFLFSSPLLCSGSFSSFDVFHRFCACLSPSAGVWGCVWLLITVWELSHPLVFFTGFYLFFLTYLLFYVSGYGCFISDRAICQAATLPILLHFYLHFPELRWASKSFVHFISFFLSLQFYHTVMTWKWNDYLKVFDPGLMITKDKQNE